MKYITAHDAFAPEIVGGKQMNPVSHTGVEAWVQTLFEGVLPEGT